MDLVWGYMGLYGITGRGEELTYLCMSSYQTGVCSHFHSHTYNYLHCQRISGHTCFQLNSSIRSYLQNGCETFHLHKMHIYKIVQVQKFAGTVELSSLLKCIGCKGYDVQDDCTIGYDIHVRTVCMYAILEGAFIPFTFYLQRGPEVTFASDLRM
jgi:hypothetical protein